MGIKQRFASFAYEASEARDLREVWSELQASGEFSQVAVFDASNFVHAVQRHHLWRTDTPTLPRVQELRQLLRLLLGAIQQQCPGVQLHFVFDGVSRDEELACKSAESLRREASRMLEYAVEARRFAESGVARLASFDAAPLLIEAVQALRGEHWVGRAHSTELDLDIATVLHARQRRAGLLFSDDSDFLVLFPGRVVQLESLEFLPQGLRLRSLSLQERLARFELETWEQLRLLAFLAGSDFNGAVSELPWPEMAAQAKELAQLGTWQEAVRTAAAAAAPIAPEDAEAFIANFDSEAPALLTAEPEAWACQCEGEPSLGITSVWPPGPMDPVLRRFVEPDYPGNEDRPELDMNRLLQAYARGHLSGSMLQFMRHNRASALAHQCDLLDGSQASVVEMKHAAFGRLVAFLSGPVPDAWDDEPAEAAQLRAAMLKRTRAEACGLCLRCAPELLELDKDAARYPPTPDSSKAREHFRLLSKEMVQSILEAGTSEEIAIEEANVPDWVFSGSGLHRADESKDVLHARLRSTFFVATGADLDKLGCKSPLKPAALFMQALASLGHGHVSPPHLQHVAKTLDTDAVQTDAGGQLGDARSALILGELCRWLPKFLQDVHCLCGGQPLGLSLPFSGGPAVLTAGLTHKAKNGYGIYLRSPDGVDVPDGAIEAAKDRLTSLGATVSRSFAKTGGFKVGGLAPEVIWSQHQRLMAHDDMVYKLKVKAFD